jgi:hypothetical protein
LNINELVVRHDVTNRYLEIPADGRVNAIRANTNNTTLSFSISDDTQIANNVLEEPAFLAIFANRALSTTMIPGQPHLALNPPSDVSAKDKY